MKADYDKMEELNELIDVLESNIEKKKQKRKEEQQNTPLVPCPNCKSPSNKDGIATGSQRYRCKKCDRRFKLDYEDSKKIHVHDDRGVIRTTCLHCGKDLPKMEVHCGRTKKYCNESCKHKYLYGAGRLGKKPRLISDEGTIKSNCLLCKEEFIKKQARSKFCSNKCKCLYAYYKSKGKVDDNGIIRTKKIFAESRLNLKCLCCDTPIERKTKWTRFCNEKCRLKFRSKVITYLNQNKIHGKLKNEKTNR
jgi:hypothetical protein